MAPKILSKLRISFQIIYSYKVKSVHGKLILRYWGTILPWEGQEVQTLNISANDLEDPLGTRFLNIFMQYYFFFMLKNFFQPTIPWHYDHLKLPPIPPN